MKKTFFTLCLLFSFGTFIIFQRFGQPETAVSLPAPTPARETMPTVEQTSLPQNTGTAEVPIAKTPTPTPPTPAQNPALAPKLLPIPKPAPATPKGQFTNGSYTGPVTDAYYGNVQVQVVIKNGKIASVNFLDYPQDRNNSIEINSYAMPVLSREAVTAQSANVDIVSGATATSEAFIQSLSSALAQAKA